MKSNKKYGSYFKYVENDSITAPMRFVFSDKILGLYYNSGDSKYHLCVYQPYRGGPSQYTCGDSGNFSPSRGPLTSRELCGECFFNLPKGVLKSLSV
jgi:hypothetical protein